jgi:hypothetical protein
MPTLAQRAVQGIGVADLMRRMQTISALLLSVPRIGSAANHVFKWVKPR